MRFFSVPVFGGDAAEAAMNQFLAQTRVLSIERHLVEAESPVWAICVQFDPNGAAAASSKAPASPKAKVDYKEILPPDEFAAFSRLRELRKRMAEQAGIPAYSLFTNEQLADIVRQRVTTKTGLEKVDGVGKARIDKYADSFLDVMKKWVATANGVAPPGRPTP